MAASTSASNPDYFSGRPAGRALPGAAGYRELAGRSPRTPTLGRSISSQFGSPGSFRPEQEDIVVYELDARRFTAGYAGESQPRCILAFTPDGARRVGDYRQYLFEQTKKATPASTIRQWSAGYELYNVDLRDMDLGLVEDRLERALRTTMVEYLQLDSKPRKAVLVVPSQLPTPLLEVALGVLFGHFTQPPSIAILTRPIMSCVGAGVRNALIVDIGWEESVVTAVCEYKAIFQRRSIRAGKLLVREMASTLEAIVRSQGGEDVSDYQTTFAEAEDLSQKMAWCEKREAGGSDSSSEPEIQLPLRGASCKLSFNKLAEPAEKALFTPDSNGNDYDDHDLPIHLLAYRVLLLLPTDTRALCVSRIIVTGENSKLPGLKCRLLQEVSYLAETRRWDMVSNYGSVRLKSHVAPALQERSTNISMPSKDTTPTIQFTPTMLPMQESIPHADRVHDDIKDPITLRAERESSKGRPVVLKGAVRGVETLGPWAGASLVAALRIKGVHEIEREDFQKHGLKAGIADI